MGMTDREKAIRILEGKYKNFVLRHNGELLTVNELIALLKVQELEKCENTNEARIFCCSVCGYEVDDIFIDEGRFEYPSINFCPNCGRAVKWG